MSYFFAAFFKKPCNLFNTHTHTQTHHQSPLSSWTCHPARRRVGSHGECCSRTAARDDAGADPMSWKLEMHRNRCQHAAAGIHVRGSCLDSRIFMHANPRFSAVERREYSALPCSNHSICFLPQMRPRKKNRSLVSRLVRFRHL